MDIAAMSMQMHSAQLAQQVSISMTKKVMETQEAEAANLLQMLPSTPPSNCTIDVRA